MATTATKPESRKIMIKGARLSYPNLFRPHAPKAKPGERQKEPDYNAVLIRDKKVHAKEIAELTKAIEATLVDKFKPVPAKYKNPIRDGTDREDEDASAAAGKAVYKDGYGPDVVFFSAANKRRPSVVDKDPTVPLVEADGKPYAGCYVNVCVSPWGWDHETGGKGVSFNLLAVQFTKDGEPFGGGESVKPCEVFSNESGEENADPLG